MYCGSSPTHLFRYLLVNRLRYGDLKDPKNWENLLEDANGLLNTMLGVWSTKWSLIDLKSRVEPGSLENLLRTIYEREAIAHGKNRVFVKENHTYRFI